MDATAYKQEMRREIDTILQQRLGHIATGFSDMVALVERMASLEQQTLNILQQIRDDRAQDKEDRKAIAEIERKIYALEKADAVTDAGFLGPIKGATGLVAGAVITVCVGWLFGTH